MEETLSTQIKIVNELHNKDMLEKILIKMQPLIKKYIKKLYFMDKDDAFQELNIALIESIYHLKAYKNDAICLAYLQKSVINRYNYLCKKNIKTCEYIDNLSEIVEENVPFAEDFSEIDLYIFLDEIILTFNDNQKQIIKFFMNELSDTEISLKMNVSRQYINRFRRQLKELIKTEWNIA